MDHFNHGAIPLQDRVLRQLQVLARDHLGMLPAVPAHVSLASAKAELEGKLVGEGSITNQYAITTLRGFELAKTTPKLDPNGAPTMLIDEIIAGRF